MLAERTESHGGRLLVDARNVETVRALCERCEGSGRVEWDSPTPGGYEADQTKPCPECSERGHVETAVGLPELRRLLGL